jgi:exodeoxyribonuclease V alpha subunit
LDEDTTEVREATYEGIVGDSQLVVGVDDGEWGYDAKNPHPAQFIIADESSMIDQSLLYRILTCTLDTSKILLVGDAAQLPSVGPGNVLRDTIASGVFPVVSLTDIYRQEDTSDIVLAAHAIFNGKVPDAKPQSDFSLMPVADENAVLTTIVKIAQKLQATQKEFQILSPRHSGVVGVTSLNRELREALNPARIGGTEVKIGTGTIRLGDRVMVVKNNYKLKVFNGDIGNVIRIDLKAQDIEIELEDQSSTVVRFTFQDAAGYIRLAYACSVHKAQGHEYDTVVMPLVASFQSQLQRNLLYTAVTRAKKKVILVGTHAAMEKAVANNREDERNTLFTQRLRGIFVPTQNP